MVIDSIWLTSSDTVRTRQHDDAQSRVRFQAFLGKRARQNVGGSTANLEDIDQLTCPNPSISLSHLLSLPFTLVLTNIPKRPSVPQPPRPCKQASARASKRCQQKKPPTTALSIFGLLRQGLKRRAAFSAASKVIKTRCNNQSRRREDLPQGPGGGRRKEKKYFKDAGYRTAWTDMYIYTFNEDNSILWSFSPLVFFFFFFFFFLFVLQWPRKCYWNTIAVQV